MRIARSLVTDAGRWSGRSLDSALYPIPPWQPERGFAIDRALIYALMRQESAFRTDAQSRDGARGLMQLLPSTANYVVRKRTFRGQSRNKLFDPELNIDVGQRYIDYLLQHDGVGGDLLRMATAYNAGPGNLNDFVEKVVANLWIYRGRLGQPLPTLDAVAAGDWPAYTPLDRLLQAAAKPTSGGGTKSNGVP
jgi:soluble lytic murein transglycosylase-like protein